MSNFNYMKNTIVSAFSLLLLFSVCTAKSQDTIPVVQNIYNILNNDKNESLWTLKKTDIFRINLVKMQGEGKKHIHPDAEHTILVIEGEINAEIGEKKMLLKKGDIISIPKGMPHKYIIKGKQAVIVSMDAPYYNPAKTILLE